MPISDYLFLFITDGAPAPPPPRPDPTPHEPRIIGVRPSPVLAEVAGDVRGRREHTVLSPTGAPAGVRSGRSRRI